MLKKSKKNNYVKRDFIAKIDAEYIIILGQRSNGKSFAVKEDIIKRALESGEEFAYIRRYKEDCKQYMIEEYFSDIVSTKHVKIAELEGYENDYLHITDDEREEGFKHVIQTRITKDTIGERIRTNPAMWTRKETFIDGNIQIVLDRMKEFYGD